MTTNPGAAIQRDTDLRTVREVESDLTDRLARWRDARAAFVRVRGESLYSEWLQSRRDFFLECAGCEYEEKTPEPTFAVVADVRLRASMPKEDFRARAVARLAALHDERKANVRPEPSPLVALPGSPLGTARTLDPNTVIDTGKDYVR